jgi:hypothetical protein
MHKTVAFVTNQYRCDRLIHAAKKIADQTGSELMIVGVLDCEYALDPEAVDYLFNQSRENHATMRLLFTGDKAEVLREITAGYDVDFVVTGMPHSHHSVVYDLWRKFPQKNFYTVDYSGELIEVARPAGERAVSRPAKPCAAY